MNAIKRTASFIKSILQQPVTPVPSVTPNLGVYVFLRVL
jgi:hypothetical protein